MQKKPQKTLKQPHKENVTMNIQWVQFPHL